MNGSVRGISRADTIGQASPFEHMFDKLRDHFRKKRAAKKRFSDLVTPAVVKALLKDEPLIGELKEARIEFIIAVVAGDSAQATSHLITQVVDVASAQGAEVELIGSLVMLTFGAFPLSTPRPDLRPALVRSLAQQFGKHIKMVHGVALGHHGLMGSEKRGIMRYSFILPHLDEVLKALGRIQFGQCEEVCHADGRPGEAPSSKQVRAP